MDYKEDIVCENGLRLNEQLGIIDTKGHHIHFTEQCCQTLINNLCSSCTQDKQKICEEKKRFELFLKNVISI